MKGWTTMKAKRETERAGWIGRHGGRLWEENPRSACLISVHHGLWRDVPRILKGCA